MSIHADSLIDRIRLKAQLTRWRITGIVALVFVAILLFEPDSDLGPIRGDYIARVSITGIVGDDLKLSEMLHDLRDDNYAKAVIVWIDTPGGSAVGGQQLYLDLREIAKEKPVVAVMRSMATSAGYLLALGADRIFAREGTITGSIGVIMQTAEFTELAKKLGIEPITIKSGEFKATPNPMEKYTPAQKAIMQVVIKDFFQWFVELVAERRKLDVAVATELADGRVYTGRQALTNKLIDALGGEEEALNWLEKNRKVDKELNIEDIEPQYEEPGLFAGISQMAKGKFWSGVFSGLDGLIAIWHPNFL